MIKCPYSEMEMLSARISLKDEDAPRIEDAINELTKEMGYGFFKIDVAEMNQRIAEFHGISLLDYINSPNMALLDQKYRDDVIMKVVTKLVDKGFTSEQAWALVIEAVK